MTYILLERRLNQSIFFRIHFEFFLALSHRSVPRGAEPRGGCSISEKELLKWAQNRCNIKAGEARAPGGVLQNVFDELLKQRDAELLRVSTCTFDFLTIWIYSVFVTRPQLDTKTKQN